MQISMWENCCAHRQIRIVFHFGFELAVSECDKVVHEFISAKRHMQRERIVFMSNGRLYA